MNRRFSINDRVEISGRTLAIRPHTGIITDLHLFHSQWHDFATVKLDGGATIGVAIHKMKPEDWRKA